MKKDRNSGSSGHASPGVPSPAEALRAALVKVGLDHESAKVFCDAAQVLGAVRTRTPISELPLTFAGQSALAAAQAGTRPSADAAPTSMETNLHRADVALTAAEAIASCQMRLDAALVIATAQQSSAVGSALLAAKDIADFGELSASARERWRGTTKRRTVEEIVPAIGWTPGETKHLVSLASAPPAFSAPVVAQMARGQLPWRLARALWRACAEAGRDSADSAHVAHVMCADDPETCVPERLEPDGMATAAPWNHRAFWAAVDREVAKLAQADDADPEQAARDKAARDAAFAARTVLASAGDDGMGSLTLLLPNYWVAAIKNRLVGAARAARAGGDERTLSQLQADIGQLLLAHASMGYADHPQPDAAEGAEITLDDVTRAGWPPGLITALSDLPPAVLQVIVPLIGLHDPATAPTLPSVGRVNGDRPHPTAADHTGRPGCPPCAPHARTGRDRTDDSSPAPGVNYAERDGDRSAGTEQEDSARRSVSGTRRLAWVDELLGSFGSFISPAEVRRLALSPGTTMARLLTDPADGRCVERSTSAYLMDSTMRAQILASDVTCRAPGCLHPAELCQIDHVEEFATGGPTSESNGQPLHTGHHDPKTAKHWDAHLAANRDVTWTSLLGRIYRTRAWDYRRYVTLLTDAMDAVASAPPEDLLDTLNQEVYLALSFRAVTDRLDGDDMDLDAFRRDEWEQIDLRHRDPHTGVQRGGPSPAALDEAYARLAMSGTTQPDAADSTDESGEEPVEPSPAGNTEGTTDGTTDSNTTRARHRDWPDQTLRCEEPGHDHQRWIGPHDYHRLAPPRNLSREEWSEYILERLKKGEECPPF